MPMQSSTTLAPNRGWFRFSLRTLFMVVTACASWLGSGIHQVRERERMLAVEGIVFATVRSNGSPARADQRPPLLWRLLGARTIVFVGLDPNQTTPADLSRYKALFPEADVSRAPFIQATL